MKIKKLNGDNSKLRTLTILVPTGVAITTTTARAIRLLIVTTTTRPAATTTMGSVARSNIILDYIFYGIYTMKY